jgi:hypothetical protein
LDTKRKEGEKKGLEDWRRGVYIWRADGQRGGRHVDVLVPLMKAEE